MSARLQLAPRRVEGECSDQADARIRVVLADDHALVRRVLRLLLDGEVEVDVIAEASDLATVIRHVHGHQPQVLLLDPRMSNGSSVDTIRRLRDEGLDTEIVVLSMERSPALAQRAIDAGAVGFVLKDKADTELLVAVTCAARGDEYVSSDVAAGLDALRRGPFAARLRQA